MALASRRIVLPTLAAFIASAGIASAGPLRGDGDGSKPPREPGVSARASAASDGGDRKLRDFTVTSTLDTRTCCNIVDADRSGGASIGDFIAGSFEVRRTQVHRAHFTQTITEMEPTAQGEEPHPRTTMGQTMYAFRDGTISVQFVQDERQAQQQGQTLRGAITGGTGAYAGARGELLTRYTSTVEEEEQTGLQVARERFDFVDGR